MPMTLQQTIQPLSNCLDLTKEVHNLRVLDTKTIQDLTFNNICVHLNSEEVDQLYEASSDEFNSWLVKELLQSLSDNNSAIRISSLDRVRQLYDLTIRLHKALWIPVYDYVNEKENAEKLIGYCEQTRYCIDAAYGHRVATVKEVESGLVKIYGDNIVCITNEPSVALESAEKSFINLIVWALTGYWRYYLRAGLDVQFDKNGNTTESVAQIVLRKHRVFERLCELLNSDTYYSGIINKMVAIKKLGPYKYPEYAADETEADEPISFIINQVEKLMPRYKGETLGKCARALRQFKKGDIKEYSTEDKINFRKGYIELRNPGTFDKKDNSFAQEQSSIKETTELCEAIRDGVKQGLLSESAFAVKVASTIASKGYKYCSDKQKRVLIEAINAIEAKRKEEDRAKNIEKAVSESGIKPSQQAEVFQLDDLSDLLGKGLLSDE